MKYLACFRIGSFALAACCATGAQAQVLIQPVTPEFAPRQRVLTVTVTLAERAPAPVRLQAQVLRWRQDALGRDLTEAASELVVSPPLAEIKPGHRQVFRIALRQPQPLRQEGTYRLVLEDVAQAPVTESTGETQAGLHIRMKYDLPVMVPPEGRIVQALRWKPCSVAPRNGPAADAATDACVRIENAGNRRIQLAHLRVAGDGWEHQMTMPEGGALVLAGAQRELRIPAASGRAGAIRRVEARNARGETVPVDPGGM